MLDGNPATAWRTAGDATGQSITITLPAPSVVSRVGLVNGYAKQVGRRRLVPQQPAHPRPSVGLRRRHHRRADASRERPDLQRLKVPTGDHLHGHAAPSRR